MMQILPKQFIFFRKKGFDASFHNLVRKKWKLQNVQNIFLEKISSSCHISREKNLRSSHLVAQQICGKKKKKNVDLVAPI